MRDTPLFTALHARRCIGLLLLVATLPLLAPSAYGDRVVRKNGRHVEGRVISVDEQNVLIETARGRLAVPRSEVASIHFAEDEEKAPPPLKVEIRNVRSDDAVDVFLHDELIIEEASSGGQWADITGKLNSGNNPLRLRIHNERGGWAYQLSLRINGAVTRLTCGTPSRVDKACRCCGKTGREIGVIDDLPIVWIYVDRELGTAEVIP